MWRKERERFYHGKRQHPLRNFCLSLLLFVCICSAFFSGFERLSDTTRRRQKESLESALSRSISQCYAVEGAYPPDITYLQEHYGLTYDSSLFLIDYISYGSNLRPEVTVLQKKQK